MTGAGEKPLAIFALFLRLGLTAFGGTEAQLRGLRRTLVDRRGWFDGEAFDALAAAARDLPGGGAFQAAMAAGAARGGLSGLAAAAIGYLAPAAVLAILVGCLWPRLEAIAGGAWIHGVKCVAAALILNGLVGHRRRLAAAPVQLGLALGAGVGLLLASGPAAQAAAILVGAVFGYALLREDRPAEAAAATLATLPALVALAVMLVALPVAATLAGSPHLGLASAAFRAGALSVGDGQMLLPLLEAETHGRGWISVDDLVAGFAAVSALPGPLAAYAGFIGAAQDYTGGGRAAGGWTGGLIALAAAVTPTVALAIASQGRTPPPGLKAALAGGGAAAVGMLAASLWRVVLPAAISRPTDFALVAAAWIFIGVARFPPWLTVLGFAVATAIFRR